MEPKTRQRKRSAGFSLGEMLVTVVIGGMLLTAVLGIYNRANRAAVAVLEKIDSPSLAAEVLQLIGEDIDRGFGADDMILQIRNGFDGGYVRSDLVLRRLYHDKDNKEQTLDEITWRAASDGSGLVLYRSREGAGQEDKLLEDQREDWEKNYPFVPICRGLTFFQVQAVKGEELLDQWPPSAPPAGVKVTISFAEPYETIRGTRDVPEERKISRTFAVNAMRKIKFVTDPAGDANAPDDANQSNLQERGDSDGPTPGSDRTTSARSSRGTTSNERTPLQTKQR